MVGMVMVMVGVLEVRMEPLGGQGLMTDITVLSAGTGYQGDGLVYMKLIPDWRDPECATNERVKNLQSDKTVPSSIISRFTKLLATSKPLPCHVFFDPLKGWQHSFDSYIDPEHMIAAPDEETSQEEATQNTMLFVSQQFYRFWKSQAVDKRFQASSDLQTMSEKQSKVLSEYGLIKHETLSDAKIDNENELANEFEMELEDASSESVVLQTSGRPQSTDRESYSAVNFLGVDIAFLKTISLGDLMHARRYLEHGIDVNTQRAGMGTGLHVCARNGYTEMIELLLEFKADINRRDDSNLTALQIAVQQGHFPSYRLLIAQLDDPLSLVDSNGNDLLQLAAHSSLSFDIVHDLVERRGLSVERTNYHGKTALDIAGQVKARARQIGNTRVPKMITDFLEDKFSKVLHEKQAKSTSVKQRPPRNASQTRAPLSLDFEDSFRLTAEWLTIEGLQDGFTCSKILHSSGVTYDTLYMINEQALIDAGISKIGARNKIMRAVARLQKVEDD
ncbi:hypothetical protein GUITHDRAFT_86267 [Guillardia theta CCMP2712]|uniref:NAD(+) ADP-ribosyltransferase n=1 Tax=Guillardia theta (strain CCMP2712) TaxID=905079 RepID=L1JID6_GUITC|nr:hypothetical protein GUITHDRAFT_86267 [Guillardia theta CCMP2712]EKX47909.1 hypothetical protein GUITHDRAFT_86267 [Guillardia theta CCMP2712]|eukprot:XP_005834889.1 hypothetical protein GUITHDRAFT_86267 [Guillardia theta CCMP2712]